MKLASAVLALLASTTQAATTQQAEVDIVLPRNTTYKPAEVFPIVLAIQNLTALQALDPRLIAFWDIMPFSNGLIPGGITYDSGIFTLPNTTITADNNHNNTTFLVATTNTSTWLSRKYRDERFALQWYVRLPGLETCGGDNVVYGEVMFNVESVWGGDSSSSWHGEIHDVLGDVPACPALGGVVQVGPGRKNATCTGTAVELLAPAATVTGRTCAVTVGPAVVSSFASAASSLAAESWASLHPAKTATSTSSAGVGPPRAVQTALAAACVLGGLVL